MSLRFIDARFSQRSACIANVLHASCNARNAQHRLATTARNTIVAESIGLVIVGAVPHAATKHEKAPATLANRPGLD
jgi:hypothetical protein